MKYKILTIVFLIVFIYSKKTISQERNGGEWNRNSNSGQFQMPLMSVKGQLLDSETKVGLSYASISIFTTDLTLISGGISNENGKFRVEIDPKEMIKRIRENRLSQKEDKKRNNFFKEI